MGYFGFPFAVYEQISLSLRRAIDSTDSPGAVLFVGDRDRTFVHVAEGLRQRTPETHPAKLDTLYDLASITKVIVTTTSILMLRDAGEIRLEQPVTDFVPIPQFREMTLAHLLTHTAGLTPGSPYYKTMDSLEAMLLRYAKVGVDSPVGGLSRYSDVGFMLLGKVVEMAARDRLDRFARRQIFEPLGMERTGYLPPPEWVENCAATEKCKWRGRVMLGEVHDENTFAVGGIAGHAGLFSTAADVALFCRGLLTGKLLRESTVVEMSTMDKVSNYPWQGLGWQIDPWASKQQGFLPSRSVFGHTGWTGTCLWMDRDTGFFTILLGNTCHPSRAKRDNGNFRRPVFMAVAKEFYGRKTSTHSGLDRVMRQDFRAVSGKRLAVLTNHAATDQYGRSIVDVLQMAPAPDIRMLYSPEHGIRGQAEAGEYVDNQESVVPVVSLYGKRKEPTAKELKDVDLFVVDLQDVGSRYYTYMATMHRCMAACAQTRTPVLVLDRPNPLGGEILEGPIAVNTESDVSSAAIPIRHGMTMGELATFFSRTSLRGSGLRIEVSLLDNWWPETFFEDTSLEWTPPSPNLPTAESALLYVGTCLCEGTNLNEGRGTETPFSLLGAPWLDAKRVIDSIPPEERTGVTLTRYGYTPVSIPGKSASPRYRDQACEGITIRVDDPRAVRPFTLAVALIQSIRARPRGEFKWGASFDVLAGGPDLRTRIEAGQSASEIVEAYRPQLEAFDRKRPKLYTPEA